MAVVGEARIVVRAITTGVADEISRALREAQANVEKDGEALGRRLSDGFSKGFGKKKKGIFGDLFDADAAEKARQQFASLQKTGMTMQTAFGSIAGSIGSLVVALGALVGSAGAAASSMVALAGAGVGVGIGMKLAGMALGGVTGPMKAVNSAAGATRKTVAELREEMQQLRFDAEEAALSEKEAALNLEKARENLARVQDLPPNSMARREAELSYEQADLALRRAIDRNNDLQEEIKNGPKQDAGAGNDPYKGLTESQREFAKTLVKLKPKFDELKEAVAKGFLPILGEQIETLFTTNFPTLLRMFTGIGQALGDATDKVFDFINSTDGMALFESLFKESEGVIRDLGETLALTLESLLIVLREAAPLTQAFTGWIRDSAKTFNDYVKKVAESGEMQSFFEDAGRVAKDFGEIFGNIFSGIKGLISDSLQVGSGGDELLQWLKGATEGFANMANDPGFSEFMKNATVNATKMFDALGEIIGIIIGMADDPAVGEFWDTLAKASEPLKELLENGMAAGDEMADLIVQITEIAASFGDAGQLEAFFGTLRDIAKTVAEFLDQKPVKDFLGVLGPIVGTFLAFGTALKIASFGFKVMLGTFNMFTAPFKYFFTKDTKTGLTAFQQMKATAKDTFKNMKDAGKKAYDTIKGAATYVYDQAKIGFKMLADSAKEAAKAVGEKLKSAYSTVKDVAKNAFDQAKIGFKLIADKAKEAALAVGDKLKSAYTTVQTSAKYAFDQAKIGFRMLADKAKSAAIAVGTGLRTAFVNTAASAKVLATNIGTATVAMFKQGIQSAKNIAIMIAQRAATIGAAIAQGVLRVATVIGTAVQAAFNFVLALNPITLIVIAIVALVAALVWFFTQTEIGKQIWQGFMDFMKAAFDVLMAAFKAVGDFFVAVWNGLVDGVKFVFDLIVQAIQFYINIWVTIFQTVIAVIMAIWNGLVDGISGAINWVVGIFKSAWDGVNNFFKGFINGLIGMFEGFINFFIDGINLIIGALGKLNIKIPDWVPLVGGQTWGIKLDKIARFKLPRLAEGGVVSPSVGGSLVNVAEAGRPERIEPLDENGMSKRDKVLMDAFAQGNGGGGVNITVNPSAGMDEVELSNLVSRQLAYQLRAGGAY